MNTDSPSTTPDVWGPQNNERASQAQRLSLPGGLPEEGQHPLYSNGQQEQRRNSSAGIYNPEAPFPEIGPVGSLLDWALGYLSPYAPTETTSQANGASAKGNLSSGWLSSR